MKKFSAAGSRFCRVAVILAFPSHSSSFPSSLSIGRVDVSSLLQHCHNNQICHLLPFPLQCHNNQQQFSTNFVSQEEEGKYAPTSESMLFTAVFPKKRTDTASRTVSTRPTKSKCTTFDR
jgi:hypothetical protein